MHLAVLHIIDAGHNRRPGAQVQQSRPPGAGQLSVEKCDAGAGAGITLVEADDEQPVLGQGLLIDGHSLIAAQLFQAGAEVASLLHKKIIGEGIALFFVDKAGRQAGQVEPGKICLEPTGMDGGENDPFALAQAPCQAYPGRRF